MKLTLIVPNYEDWPEIEAGETAGIEVVEGWLTQEQIELALQEPGYPCRRAAFLGTYDKNENLVEASVSYSNSIHDFPNVIETPLEGGSRMSGETYFDDDGKLSTGKLRYSVHFVETQNLKTWLTNRLDLQREIVANDIRSLKHAAVAGTIPKAEKATTQALLARLRTWAAHLEKHK